MPDETKATSEFIYYYLAYARSRLEQIAPQSAQKNINVNREAHERARRTRKGFVRFVPFRPLRVSKVALEQAFRANLGAIEPLKH
jgi:hypothetical protein